MRRLVCVISLWALMLAQGRAAPCAAGDDAHTRSTAATVSAGQPASPHHHGSATHRTAADESVRFPQPVPHDQPCTMVVQCQQVAMPSAVMHWTAIRPHTLPDVVATGQLPATTDASTTTPPPRSFS